jgi:magnesium chelatase family protein
MVALARRRGMGRAFVPALNAPEAALIPGITVYPVESLSAVAGHLLGSAPLPALEGAFPHETRQRPTYATDFADIVGQEHAKRALEVSAAGGHNVILRGPPGSGKTLLARAMPSILPDLTSEEAMEVTRIQSVAGLLAPGSGVVTTRPFRTPHHTISHAGLVGGGSPPRPGEITLAHRGVLFLDELPEFDPRVLEVLRQPLEDQKVTISRAAMSLTFPASFMLAAAMNPCPCGFWNDPTRECRCTPLQIQRYVGRISGPLLDRIDIHIDVPAVKFRELTGEPPSDTEDSASIRQRVIKARERQQARFATEGIFSNAAMTPRLIRRYCKIDLESETMLERAMARLGLSARAYDRILKVSRTIADLEGADEIQSGHVAEAVHYRSLDRTYWT